MVHTGTWDCGLLLGQPGTSHAHAVSFTKYPLKDSMLMSFNATLSFGLGSSHTSGSLTHRALRRACKLINENLASGYCKEFHLFIVFWPPSTLL